MKTFNLDFLVADKSFYTGPCDSLIVPALDGKYGIMANHHNVIIAIIPGALFYRIPGEDTKIVSVSHGLVKVENNEVLILVDSAESLEDIDANRAKRAALAAREAILHSKSRQEYSAAQARLARAMSRLHIKDHYDPLYDKGK